MKRRFLKAKEARLLLREAHNRLGVKIDSGRVEEVLAVEDTRIFLAEGEPRLIEIGEALLPTLVYYEALERLPNVVVDMGAVPHICGGADVMAPGVTAVEGEFENGDLVVIRDDRHRKALALGLALFSSGELREMGRGRVVRNIHYVGDKVWKAYKQ